MTLFSLIENGSNLLYMTYILATFVKFIVIIIVFKQNTVNRFGLNHVYNILGINMYNI